MYQKFTLYTILLLLIFLSQASSAEPINKHHHNIPVPFTSQAPEKNWDQPWQDACEEAAISMVDAFYQKKTLDTKNAKHRILDIFDIKNTYFGESLDEGAEKLTSLINLFLPWEAQVIYSPTLREIQKELKENRPVIVPVYGAALKNPHFSSDNVQYHMIVLSGYNETERLFITQEPGTRHGLDYQYPYDTIMNAITNHNQPKQARLAKAAIFTSPMTSKTSFIDKDADGLSKKEELHYGTKPHIADSDNDGHNDGIEVRSGYLPTVNEQGLPSGSLIKTTESPKVYIIKKNTKHHIRNEYTFLANGWEWQDIIEVSTKYIATLNNGSTIETSPQI